MNGMGAAKSIQRIRELAVILENPPGTACGESVTDLCNDGREMADFPNDYTQAEVSGVLSSLIRTLEEIQGLLK